ncbi:hypothetical protein JJL45_09935 [Tamlana sp. s12]|uniref:hypothetical protein n=1 Tax=Tamlana sp. s12 TaxID=1630406 RepID=UPI0007FEE1DA|nr:hypothetical protein [Tamlana sp. s12]OBQ54229.1 hypothetical protein VQ01_12335 [Tamlana sp. s12]QQY81248.1 hypothetical protein JJL45_09935 [Tamlana sp. s12]
MRNGIYKTLLISIFFLAFISCSNDDDSNHKQSLNGNYNGTFTVEYLNGDTFSNSVTVRFSEGNNYQSSGNKDYFPAGGSGTYKKSNSTIEFFDINFWTTNFDWHLILGGEYEYSIKGNELILSKSKSDFGIYKYELTKGK